MQLACPQCGTREVRVSQNQGLGEYCKALFGIYQLRCRRCHARWGTSVWSRGAWRYARCPRCYRQELTTWSEQYYHPRPWIVTLLRLGGHFPGGTVLHWADGAEGRGAILSGDIVQVAADLSRVSFLWSYPNMMPLAAVSVRRIAGTVASWRFERVYGAFPGRQVMAGGAQAVQRSAARYIELLEGSQA